MACPTCDHTMQRIARDAFWCPRCGSLQVVIAEEVRQTEAPKLVKRCREFITTIGSENILRTWHRLGIAESINIPEERLTI